MRERMKMRREINALYKELEDTKKKIDAIKEEISIKIKLYESYDF